MRIMNLVLLSTLIVFSSQQLVMPATPSNHKVYLGETTTLVLDGDSNAVNGASCIDTFIIADSSPDKPTWVSNNELEITFTIPTTMDLLGIYTLHYTLTETGTGSCTFIPVNREISITIAKRAPTIQYVIPDYPNLRAAVPFEIVFPTPPFYDPLDSNLDYTLLKSDNTGVPSYINLDMDNNRIYGTVPNLNHGSYNLRLV